VKFPISPFFCAIALSLAPPGVLSGDPAKLLMPFLGLFMAGVFPAISLTVGSLKSGGFSVQRIQKLSDELAVLLNYLQLVFLSALIAALTLVVAEAVDWGNRFIFSFYTSRVFNVVVGLCLGILLSALPKMRRTFSALLAVAREIAVDEASTKINDRALKLPSVGAVAPPAG
jgi:hypothetical protein